MHKEFAKSVIRQRISKLNFPLVINSYGRSGSTVLTESIIQDSVALENNLIKNLSYKAIDQTAWDLSDTELKNGAVYKTHDYPPSVYSNKDIKMLYTFADPVDVVLSLLRLFEEKGVEWMKEHYQHLGVEYTDTFDQIIHEDQLQLERHLDTWLKETRIPIAFIRYEVMWEHQKEISKFLGFTFNLPQYKQRKADKKDESKNIEFINKTYAGLKKKISNLDSFFIINT